MQVQYIANTGTGFNNTPQYYSQYFSSRAPMADLIALGLYQAVRAGGGPIVPVRAGRVDAAGPGLNGVPQPTDLLPKMIGIFQSMGFTARRDGHDNGLWLHNRWFLLI
jgi:hypothetical protein